MKPNQRYIAAQAKIFKALGHTSRLTMVTALQESEKCVCELQQVVGCDMSTISKHLAVLKEAGIVSTRGFKFKVQHPVLGYWRLLKKLHRVS